jgi:phosphatidate cytidylyltransferase
MLLFSEVLLSSGKIPVAEIGYCLMSGLIIPLLLSALVRIRGGQNSNTVMFIPFIMAFFSDTGAYFIGVFFGKHKMCPNISPKKSWEGFVGGIVVAMLGMVVYCMIVDNLFGYSVNYVLAVIYGLVGSIGSVVGDLTMSVIKRQAGIKDYGKLIPGHGGILDRFDSVIITAPLTEALMILIPMVV